MRLIRMRRLGNPEQHRRADEQINYWRQRAGWFDDEETMEEYNQGVYETYYEYDDDAYTGRNGGGRGGSKSAIVKNGLKVLCVLVALGLSALMFRAIMRRVGTTKKEKKRSSDSRSRSGRSKSKSRSRSRSQSRKSRSGHGHGHGGSDYNLMDDDDGKSARSKRSTRSKSGSRNKRRSSRSRSRPRSRSKGRSSSDHRNKKEEPAPHTEPVLV